jgi:signal transduction histidine kinase
LRFYAGTPLTTKRGINIGSLSVMDAEPRQGLSQEEIHVMGWLASSVVTYLETNRQAMEGKRSKLMSTALSAFVDGESRTRNPHGDVLTEHFLHADVVHPDREPSTSTNRNSKNIGNRDGAIDLKESSPAFGGRNSDSFQDGSEAFDTMSKDRTMTTSSDPSSEGEDFRGTAQDEVGSKSHRFTFGRAANLLRECFEMDSGDGVFFLEAGTGLTHTSHSGPGTGSEGNNPEEAITTDRHDGSPISRTHQIGTNTSFDPLIGAFAKHAKNPASILACSTKHEPFLRGQYPGDRPALGDVDQEILRELFKRYPQGKIWIVENGALAQSSEDDQRERNAHRTSSQRRRRSQYGRGEASMMARLFAGVRQILFVPLWDAGACRWASGCFLWSVSNSRVFSAATDLAFLSSFGKTIMAECSRLDTLLADKQKADFIGSVSHELRSPLHGILAGAEFLTETVTTPFQRSLIGTVEACCRTLLDTINHVLDFSKINSVDRHWRNRRQSQRKPMEGQTGPGAQISSRQMPSGAPPMLRLYAVTDIAAVTEEVVEGLSVGQIYAQATDLTDISARNRGRGSEKGLRVVPHTHGGRQKGEEPSQDAIEVLLDIAREDWVFMAQPGAIRRIIMNLFGK